MQQNPNQNPMTCPSFNSYSSDRLAEIVTKVTDEFKAELQAIDDTFDIDTDEFEFSLEASSDQIFGPVFPIFNRDFRVVDDGGVKGEEDEISPLRVPLKNLFLQEREPNSSSSSEADELETVPPGTYCVWKPKEVESSPARCNKSKSTGSVSKRFSIRDFIRRSNSEGKESFVFLTPKKEKPAGSSNGKGENLKLRRQSVDSGTGKLRTPPSPSSSAHEKLYVQNRAMKEDDRRKSYLPYRKDLVGFFGNVNGLGKAAAKALPPS